MDESSKKLRDSILKLLDQRGIGKTICPSEAARDAFPDAWRDHMQETRLVAEHLHEEGLLVFFQKGSPVVPSAAKGPIRLGK